jgi:hemin uptake protein HemP
MTAVRVTEIRCPAAAKTVVTSPLPQPDAAPDPSSRGDLHGQSVRIVRSEELLQGRVEVLIAHGAETYRLRLTRSGKLILQK